MDLFIFNFVKEVKNFVADLHENFVILEMESFHFNEL